MPTLVSGQAYVLRLRGLKECAAITVDMVTCVDMKATCPGIIPNLFRVLSYLVEHVT